MQITRFQALALSLSLPVALVVLSACSMSPSTVDSHGTDAATPAERPSASLEPALSADSIDHWRDQIVLDETENAYREIPWRAHLWDAVTEADRKGMPLLMWAMNGHPLGCT